MNEDRTKTRDTVSPSPVSVHFSDVQSVGKFTGLVTRNPDFKGTLFFDVEYLRNDTRQTYMVTTDH